MRRSASRLVLAVTAILPLVAACEGRTTLGKVDLDFAGDSAGRALTIGEGDVAVISTDGVAVLALVGDTVRMQLTDSLRARVKAEVDSSIDGEAGAFGAMIARTVSKTVSGAMGFVMRVPVTEVENIRYEEGAIRFESSRNSSFSFGADREGRDQGHRDGRGLRFSPADGERFVETVKQRQRELGMSVQ